MRGHNALALIRCHLVVQRRMAHGSQQDLTTLLTTCGFRSWHLSMLCYRGSRSSTCQPREQFFVCGRLMSILGEQRSSTYIETASDSHAAHLSTSFHIFIFILHFVYSLFQAWCHYTLDTNDCYTHSIPIHTKEERIRQPYTNS